jgi:hypothetical protein
LGLETLRCRNFTKIWTASNITLYQSVEYKNYNLRKVVIPSRKCACVRLLPKEWFGHLPTAIAFAIWESVRSVLEYLKERRSKWNFMLYSYLTCKPSSGTAIGVPLNSLQFTPSGRYFTFILYIERGSTRLCGNVT